MTRKSITPRSQRETFQKLDGRGLVARRLKAMRQEFADALGGWEALSPQKRQLVKDTAEVVMRRDWVWQQMVSEPESVSGESERRWAWLGNVVRRNLIALGLDRVDAKKGSRMRDLMEE